MCLQEGDYHIVIYDPQLLAQNGEWRGDHWERLHYHLPEVKMSGADWHAEKRLKQAWHPGVLKPQGLLHLVEWSEGVMVRRTGNILH